MCNLSSPWTKKPPKKCGASSGRGNTTPATRFITTPIIIIVNGKPQLISNGSKVCLAYDPLTGKEIWRVVYGGDSTISRPIFGDGLVYVNVGYKVGSSELWAVDPTGYGDISTTHVKWKILKNIPIESSPIFVKRHIFAVDDRGTISCIDPKTGKFNWQRLFKGPFGASPITADDTCIFLTNAAPASC